MRLGVPYSFLRRVLLSLGLSLFLFLLLEGGCRVAGRVKTGAWPRTRAEAHADLTRKIGAALVRHPYLVVAGKPGARFEIPGITVTFGSRGHRGPDVPVPKPPGRFRIVCEGGSATLDVFAADDGAAWPARLGALLAPANVDVVNAGLSGWTSLESLVSLEIRDLDLEPDLVVHFSGVNDAQPAGHVPFTSDYSKGHGDILPRVLGAEATPLPLVSRSLFIESLGDRLHGAPRREIYGAAWEWKGGARKDDIPDEAVAAYERNLRSAIAVAKARGASTLLVAQTLHLRPGAEEWGRDYVESWTPGLTVAGYRKALERYNGVAQKLAAEGLASFFDPFAKGAFADDDFADPVHFSPAGSERFARVLAGVVETTFLRRSP
jgi:lysophospholipase L1-like esterase